MSDQPEKIAAEKPTNYKAACAAFLKAQAEFQPIQFDKENPHFHSKYASLQAILAATRPVLNKNGIALTTRTRVQGETIVVETYLIHDGVAFVRAAWPAGKTTTPPQQLGSALTYARRYTLQSVLGVAADEDDDANAATQTQKQEKPNNGYTF